jgi:hypothetical protein
MFHCCCWAVLSALRYLYIVHENWIHDQFSKPAYVSWVGLACILFLFFVSLSGNLFILITRGWPKNKVFEMSMRDGGLCISSLLGSYIILISISCGFYSLVLRQRGKMGNNKTHPENVSVIATEMYK